MPIIEFKLPKMGESIAEATVLSWSKKEGQTIDADDILLEVATDKVDTEVPFPYAGIVKEILFQPNDIVKIGAIIALIEVSEEALKTLQETTRLRPAKSSLAKTVPDKQKTSSKKQKPDSYTIDKNQNTFFSPLVVSIAKQHHISYEELARIEGSGEDGRLRKSDIMQYIADGRPAQFAQPVVTGYSIPQLTFDKGKGKIVEMDRMRQMIADHMVYSKHTSPHVTSYVEADLTNMVQWRTENKKIFLEKYGEKLTFTPLFVEAIAKAVKDFPMINVSVDGTNIIVKDHINIGMATALPSGNLIVPVIKDADQKNLLGLAAEINSLSAKARENKLKPEDIQGSTFTISNVGTFGSLMGTPIINQPEAAILAIGIIKKRAQVMERDTGDSIEIRHMMYLSLSFDHRIVDGYLGGSFLKRIADYFEQFDIKRTI